ncbi:rhomboid family intramembrane serine protease [Helicovermis profundi]|uniref:Rhomboid family intramembrane serine protease n=1 Tax=Helicovermis profundi TaxID=3065157 RepID=A0AAU9EGQ2_9FIRM|nr:rhomboid family intramembrane serine protease [Clostridia bacterium S502]
MESIIKNKKIYLTDIILITNIVVFLISLAIKYISGSDTLLLLGAKINYKIANYELYRLVTPMLLHGSFTHILFNSIALLSFGRSIEENLGKKRFFLIYLTAGIFGSIGSFMFDDSISIGASGGIFGLVGAYFYISAFYPDDIKKSIRKNMLVIVLINVWYGTTNPQIDNFAHGFGLISGFIAAWAYGYPNQIKMQIKNRIAQLVLILGFMFFIFVSIPSYQSKANYYIYNIVDSYNDKNYEKTTKLIMEASEKFPHNETIIKFKNSFLK